MVKKIFITEQDLKDIEKLDYISRNVYAKWPIPESLVEEPLLPLYIPPEHIVFINHNGVLTAKIKGYTSIPKECQHTETYKYTGLNQTDTYCKHCDKKV